MIKLICTLVLTLCALATKAEVVGKAAVACAPVSILLSNDKMVKQKAVDYKHTTYWKKHKRYKVGAYCVLGVGACATLLGVGILSADATPDWNEAKAPVGAIITAGGAAIAAASIPLFVAAHKNKKKAKNAVSLSLNCSGVSAPSTNGTKRSNLLLGACLNF